MDSTMKIYDLVEQWLKDYPEFRSNDNLIIWKMLERKEIVTEDSYGRFMIDRDRFVREARTETIRRSRQDLQKRKKELLGTIESQIRRHQIAEEKGTHIYREQE